MEEGIGLGILGWGELANRYLAPVMSSLPKTKLLAIGTRFSTEAQQIPEGVEVRDYEGVLRDPKIKAVHIANSNELHVNWVKAAIEYGKHVLCEKPMAFGSPEELKELLDLAQSRGVLVAEAFMYRHHEQYQKLDQILESERVGNIRRLDIRFTYRLKDRGNIRWRKECIGGALADVGCYGIDFSRSLVGNPIQIQGFRLMDHVSGVDSTSTWTMLSKGNVLTRIHVSMEEDPCHSITVYGEKGELTLPHAFIPSPGKKIHLLVKDGGGQEVIKFNPSNTFRLEWQNFLESIRLGRLIGPLTDGLENAVAQKKIIENLVCL